MPKEIKNIAASVRARLLNLARASGQSFDLVLTRFALERLLYRLSQSRYADRFVLKGAVLLMTWLGDPHRGTRDLDLLGFGDPSPEAMLAIFREILGLDVSDGILFDTEALRVDRIREELEYGGLDHVFVLGDNRDNAQDSRWIGPIPLDRVLGRGLYLFSEELDRLGQPL